MKGIFFFLCFDETQSCWCQLELGCVGLESAHECLEAGDGPGSETIAFPFWSSSRKAGHEPLSTKPELQKLSGIQARTPTLPVLVLNTTLDSLGSFALSSPGPCWVG